MSAVEPSIWLRWAAVHGVPRTFLSLRARRREPLARIMLGRPGRLELTEQIRTTGPLLRTPVVWATADYEVCRTVLRDSAFGVADPSQTGLPEPLLGLVRRVDPALPNPVEPPSMLMTDPPQHTEFRKMVSRSFTPRSITKLDARIDEMTTRLLDDLERRRGVDLVTDYAAQLPAAVISDILGVPASDRRRILGWGNSVAPLLDIGITWRAFREAIHGLRDVDAYLTSHFARLHIDGADGTPFSAMALEGGLTERELLSNATLLIGAGVETTVNLIGNGIAALLDHPEQLAMLRADPTLWPSAVEEVLRFDSPVQMTARSALCDTEIAGERLDKGTVIVLLLGGANRDPQVFDEPDSFDITRANAKDHLAFGSGIHVCLGGPLARIEGTTALRRLFERFPDLQLSGPRERRSLVTLHGYSRLPTALGPRAA